MFPSWSSFANLPSELIFHAHAVSVAVAVSAMLSHESDVVH